MRQNWIAPGGVGLLLGTFPAGLYRQGTGPVFQDESAIGIPGCPARRKVCQGKQA